MRELLVDTRDAQGADGKAYRFRYFLLIDQMDVQGGFACESYGIKIADADGGTEETVLPNITTSVSRIDELLDKLVRNFVTPTTACDIVEDWL